jgi:hypothetical protein
MPASACDEADHQAQGEIGQAEHRLLARRRGVERARVLEADNGADALTEDAENPAEQQRQDDVRDCRGTLPRHAAPSERAGALLAEEG